MEVRRPPAAHVPAGEHGRPDRPGQPLRLSAGDLLRLTRLPELRQARSPDGRAGGRFAGATVSLFTGGGPFPEP